MTLLTPDLRLLYPVQLSDGKLEDYADLPVGSYARIVSAPDSAV